MLSLRAGAQYRFRDLESKDVREVAAIITPSDVHLGKDATEARFKEQAGYYPNLYISSHAVADERRPLYSFIVLAQDSAGHEDGFLNAHEVFNLDLDADLVTLSACETGLGKLSRGEGIVGLTRAFLCAGASSLLMSLWSVDERSTKIMPMFYRNRAAGQSKGEALRMAKLELLRTRIDGISYAHPFLWAAFVLSGNTGLERTRPNEEGMPR
jgi:CHAT domain-containing protein